MEEKFIAVFGDTHGRVRLMLQLCRLWQMRHKRHLDGILQCGDLGFFPDHGVLDGATSRFADEDPEELGFAKYSGFPPAEPDGRVEEWLDGPEDSFGTIRVPAYWCHGNHEDFEELAYLATNSEPCAVDTFGKLVYLPSGALAEVEGIRVAAVGGSYGESRTPRHRARENERHADYDAWQRIKSSVCDQLQGEAFDVLLSHVATASAPGEINRPGSRELRELVEHCQPAYHFFAHHRGPIAPFDIGRNHSYWLRDVAFTRRGTGHSAPLNPGCMGILHWKSPDEHQFEILNEPWQSEVTCSNWHTH